jgi:hypothetical protein
VEVVQGGRSVVEEAELDERVVVAGFVMVPVDAGGVRAGFWQRGFVVRDEIWRQVSSQSVWDRVNVSEEMLDLCRDWDWGKEEVPRREDASRRLICGIGFASDKSGVDGDGVGGADLMDTFEDLVAGSVTMSAFPPTFHNSSIVAV